MYRETKFAGANGNREIMFIFAVQLTTSRIGNLTRLIHTLAICDDHTYIHTYMRSDSHACFFLFFFFFFLYGDVAFFEYFCTIHYRFLFVWRVRRTFLPSGWRFSTVGQRAGSFTFSLLCENSIDRSITPVSSTCPLHTSSGCGKDRRILFGPR